MILCVKSILVFRNIYFWEFIWDKEKFKKMKVIKRQNRFRIFKYF